MMKKAKLNEENEVKRSCSIWDILVDILYLMQWHSDTFKSPNIFWGHCTVYKHINTSLHIQPAGFEAERETFP